VTSLRAPLAVPVEIRVAGRTKDDEDRRLFRLSASVGEDGVRLARPAPFEIGRPVSVRFTLPLPDAGALSLDAEVLHADAEDERRHEDSTAGTGGRELTFVHAPAEARAAIRAYVRARLTLPA
jgi:PilZ domain